MSKWSRILLIAPLCSAAMSASAAPIAWSGWNAELFAKAKADHRFVILDLEAVWCHWCHVMNEKTYSNDKVEALIGAKYLPVRVDQDGNPDLSSRYGDWGWPATIIFAPDGTEIVKQRGYIEPERMQALLQAVIDDPSPGPSVEDAAAVTPAKDAFLSKSQRADLRKTFDESYDAEHGGWGGRLRYIDSDSMDYDLALAAHGDETAATQARQTLDAAIALIDPVWGGVSQYSDNGAWNSPHFEKIIAYQAQYLRQYSEAYARWKDPRYLRAATAIYMYLTKVLLGSNGAFYTSQDADLDQTTTGHVYYALDDAARRKLGMPRIDTHQYARENGWAIAGLVAYYDVTADTAALATAERAALWVRQNRSIASGGFRHGAKDRGGPFLGDTLAMGQAFVSLYAATGTRDWLAAAGAAGAYIGATFDDPAGGFLPNKTTEATVGAFTKAPKQIDDQIAVARFLNLLARYTGEASDKALAAEAMRYAVGAAAGLERPLPGLLLADVELGRDPTHVTVVGHKDDPDAQRLAAAARALPVAYKRLDWWDTREGPMANQDITYPDLDQSAAFACGNRICSLPVLTPSGLTAAVQKMASQDIDHAAGSVK